MHMPRINICMSSLLTLGLQRSWFNSTQLISGGVRLRTRTGGGERERLALLIEVGTSFCLFCLGSAVAEEDEKELAPYTTPSTVLRPGGAGASVSAAPLLERDLFSNWPCFRLAANCSRLDELFAALSWRCWRVECQSWDEPLCCCHQLSWPHGWLHV